MTTVLCNSRTSAAAAAGFRQRLVPALSRPVPLRCAPCRAQKDKDFGVAIKEKIQDATSKGSSTGANEGLKVNPLVPDFTRRREVFAGRLAMFGFFAAGFWEWFYPNHPNIVQQVVGFNNAVGVPIGPSLVVSLVAGLVAYNAISALALSGAKDNQQDVQQRPEEVVQFEVKDWGFTKANELLHGRIAMIGFFGALVNQVRIGGYGGGPGPLAQAVELFGGQANDGFYSTVPGVFLLFSVLVTALAYANGKPGNQETDGPVS